MKISAIAKLTFKNNTKTPFKAPSYQNDEVNFRAKKPKGIELFLLNNSIKEGIKLYQEAGGLQKESEAFEKEASRTYGNVKNIALRIRTIANDLKDKNISSFLTQDKHIAKLDLNKNIYQELDSNGELLLEAEFSDFSNIKSIKQFYPGSTKYNEYNLACNEFNIGADGSNIQKSFRFFDDQLAMVYCNIEGDRIEKEFLYNDQLCIINLNEDFEKNTLKQDKVFSFFATDKTKPQINSIATNVKGVVNVTKEKEYFYSKSGELIRIKQKDKEYYKQGSVWYS